MTSFIHLGADNKVLKETIKHKLQATKIEPCDTKLYDFDDVFYRIFIDPENRSKMLISVETPNFQAIRAHGTEDFINSKLSDYVQGFTDDGCTFEIGLDDEKNNDSADVIGDAFSKLRIYTLGGPLTRYCTALQMNEPLTDAFHFSFRPDTHMWIVPKKDRVTVIYGFEFPVKADRIIGNQILTVVHFILSHFIRYPCTVFVLFLCGNSLFYPFTFH